jgi:nucleotidyltransferase substrate binding protein (TIGR01987 family)
MKKFGNFCRAIDNLKIINKYDLPLDMTNENSNLIVAGLINLYNICFELSWKVLKEQLLWNGYDEGKVGSPRIILKTAYTAGMISDESLWLNALRDRNDVMHLYSEDVALSIIDNIKNLYLSMFENLKTELELNWKCDGNADLFE